MAIKAAGGDAVKPYALVEDLVRPVLRVGMPRALRTEADSDRDRDSEEAREAGSRRRAGGTQSNEPSGGTAGELKPCPRKITRLGPKWCPVPFFVRFPCAPDPP